MNNTFKMKTEEFGITREGERATLYTISNPTGMTISVCDYGATLVSVKLLDKDGIIRDVVLGYDDVKGYEQGGSFQGATVGRSANRIGKAMFTLNGTTYHLDKNDGEHNLHSGNDFYNKRMWKVESKGGASVTFTLHSQDHDQGYPGALDMKVTYELTEDGQIKIDYLATPDKDTPINMTNHSYFNLNGHEVGDILEHQVWIDADYFTASDETLIPTGELVEVKGTPMDFTIRKPVGKDMNPDYDAIRLGKGYDHNWALNNRLTYCKVAEMMSSKTGILMEVYTDLPGMQFYTGNFLTSEQGKNGAEYRKRSGACFETQYFPDSVNHTVFESPVCKAGSLYRTTTTYKFSVE